MVRRRAILKSALALAAGQWAYSEIAGAAPPAAAAPGAGVQAAAAQPTQPFDYAWLKGQARKLAGNPYQASQDTLPPAMAKLSYDQFQSLRFRTDHALWGNSGLAFRLQFFHVGRSFTEPVRLYEIVDGQAREIVYDPAMFEFDKAGIDPKLMRDHVGFAGFRVQFVTDWKADVAAFLGASYFRAVGGDTRQYGLSARALAVDTAFPRPEEFPRFTSFWFERPAKESGTLTLYAMLDSPSIAGALRFQITPGGTQIMDIDSALYPRKPIERLGIAPLTSMFFYGENDRRAANDWRPEIHDSDGLSMWTGAGEWIWRPLTNPAQLHFSSYLDDNPRGFGLLQRDRNFDHYQDDGVYYDRRPSLWVEPKPAPRAAGARARCSWSRSRPSMKPSTTSSRSGIRPRSPRRARNCCSAIAFIGAHACRTGRRSRKPSRRAPASAARWARSANIIPGILPSTSPAANSVRSPRMRPSKP